MGKQINPKSLIDVEELRTAQVQIESGRERYYDFYDLAPVGYCTLSEQGLILEANLTAATLLGTNRGALTRQPLSRFIFKEDQDIYYLHCKQLVEAGEVQECELRLVKPNGADFWAHLTTTAVQAEDAAPICRVVLSDITQRKQAEEKLAESEEKFRALFEKGPIAAAFHKMVYDNAGKAIDYRFLDANSSYQELTGVDPIGKCVTEAFPGIENDPFDWIGTFGRVARTGEQIRFEQYLQSNERWYDCVGYQVKPDYFVAAFMEITKRKRAEAEQEKLQAQLNQAQKMEAIGTMAGGIAHDFNNLLAIVSSNIEAIQIKQQRKSPFEKNVENIITAGSRAKNLVSQILAFSRQEKTELKPIDLSATIDESLKLLHSTIPKTIEIVNVLANRPIFIDADSTRMQQVLFNLCNNANHAMNGKGLLKIALNEVDISPGDLPVSSKLAAGTYAKLSISDTGPGIDKQTLTKIFDPFFTTKAVGAGTGLGLSVVHGVVEQHGGFITVDSSPGQGTTFDLYFPARVNTEVERTTSNAESLPTGTERILFVDDEECIAYTCNELLECQGYKVTSVTSGNEALDLFKANPGDFDLVFTDQAMPVMSGAELATELLKIRPDIPIILCSGYSAMVSEEVAEGIGIREFCMKPMDMKQLATVVRKVLDESGKAT